MANPLFNQLFGGQSPIQQQLMPKPTPMMSGVQFANPMQKMNYIMQAMRNPAAFVRQNLPGIPEQAFNDPSGNTVLQYMQQNMGVTQQDVQRAYSQIPQF